MKLKEGEVKNKVGNFRRELDQEYIRSRLKARVEEMEGVADYNYFSIDHPKTKEASNFVQEMQNRRK